MAFRLESTFDGAATIVNSAVMMKDTEAGTEGEAMVITANRLTKAAATASPDLILAQTTAAGTNVATTYVRVRPDQVFLADVAGTFGNLVIGQTAVCIDATGLKVDAAALTGGKVEILGLDSVKSKARVRFRP